MHLSTTLARRALAAGAAVLATGGVAAVPGRAATPPAPVPHVLVFSHTEGFRHESIDKAKVVLREMSAKDRRFTFELADAPKDLTPARLARTDVLLWLHNTAGEGRRSPFTDAQEQTYVRWMLCGGGHVGVHAAVDSYGDEAWPEYVEANGGIMVGHPITPTELLDEAGGAMTGNHDTGGWGQPEATIGVRDQSSPMTAPWRGRTSFRYRDEYYKIDRDPATVVRSYRLLLSLDRWEDPQAAVLSHVQPGTFPPNAPLAWSGSFRGANRTFYTNLGHSIATWDNARFREHLENGLVWAAGPRATGPDAGCLGRAGIR